MILLLKMTKKFTHNMIFMSRYKGQLHGGKRQKIWPMPSPPLFGQCPKENILFYRRCSLKGKDCFDSEWLFMCKKTFFKIEFSSSTAFYMIPFLLFHSSILRLRLVGPVLAGADVVTGFTAILFGSIDSWKKVHCLKRLQYHKIRKEPINANQS